MRPFSFTSARDSRVTVNPAMVVTVEVRSAARTDKPHVVGLSLRGQSGGDGLRQVTVAEFDARDVAEQMSERIVQHLWCEDAPALTDDERRLIDANRAVHDDDTFAAARTSTPTDQSKHPALVAERDFDKAAKKRDRRMARVGRLID